MDKSRAVVLVALAFIFVAGVVIHSTGNNVTSERVTQPQQETTRLDQKPNQTPDQEHLRE